MKKVSDNGSAFSTTSGGVSNSAQMTNDTLVQKPFALGLKRPGQSLGGSFVFGGAQPPNQMLTSLAAAITQQRSLQDPSEELPFTAKQLQRELTAQQAHIMEGIFKKPQDMQPIY